MTNVPFDIYTVGGIEFLSQVYKGLVMVFGASQFNTMIKLFTAFGFIGAILMVAAKNKVSLFTNHIIGAFVLFNMFFSIKSDVTIIDTMYNRTYVVSNVPIGPAFVSSLASSGSYVITNLLTNAFHTGTVNVYDSAGSGQNAWSSTTLDYQGTGYGGYFKRLNDLKKMGLSNFQTKDMSVLYGMAKTYLKDCKMPEYAFMSDDSFYTAVMKSTNLLESIAPEVNGLMNYNGTQYECVNFYDTVLKPKWDAVVPAFVADSKNFAYLGVTPDTVAGLQAGIAESLKLGSAALSDMIMVAGIGCAINASYQDYIGGGSQANPVNLAMAFEVCRNIEESKQMGKQLGLYALETIPMMKIAMETLFIALSPVLVLLLFIPGNLKVIKGFVMTIAWIYMWDPVLAAINGIVNIAAIAKVQAALEASGAAGAFTLEATNIMYNAVDYIPAVAGYLGISAPGIALMLIKGGEITMANIASMMANPVMSTPIHQEAAQSSAVADVAKQTGKSYGSVMMASLSRPWETAAAVGRMKTYDELGASTLSDAAYGHDINAAAKGIGEANVHRQLGTDAFQREVAAMEGLQRDSVLRGEVTGQVIQERGEATYKAGLKGGMEQSLAGGVAAGEQGFETLYQTARTGLERGRIQGKAFAWAIEARGEKNIEEGMFRQDLQTGYGGWTNKYDGKGGLNTSQIDNIAPTIAIARRDALSSSAAHDIAHNKEFMKTLTSGRDFQQSFGWDKSHSDGFRRSIDNNIGREMLSRKDFSGSVKTSTDQSLFAEIKAGAKILEVIGVGGGYKIQGVTSEGRSFTASISASYKESMNEVLSSASEDALRQTQSTKVGLDYNRQLAERVGATEAYRKLQQASSETSVSTNEQLNFTTQLVKDIGDDIFRGIQNPYERYDAAAQWIINESQTSNGAQGLHDRLQHIMQPYYEAGKPKGDLPTNVEKVLDNAPQLKNEVIGETGKVKEKTGNVDKQAEKDPRVGISGPNEKVFDAKHNTQEGRIEAGHAGIERNPVHKLENWAAGALDTARPMIDTGVVDKASDPEVERRRTNLHKEFDRLSGKKDER